MSLDPTVRTWIDPDTPPDRMEMWLDVPNRHNTVMVASRGETAPVDIKMAELVYMLWQLGIRTSSSCEDVLQLKFGKDYAAALEARNGKMAHLVFPTVTAFQAAVRLFDDVADFYRSDRWRLSVWAQNEDVDLAGEMLFPAAEIEGVTAYVRDLIGRIKADEETKHLLPADWS